MTSLSRVVNQQHSIRTLPRPDVEKEPHNNGGWLSRAFFAGAIRAWTGASDACVFIACLILTFPLVNWVMVNFIYPHLIGPVPFSHFRPGRSRRVNQRPFSQLPFSPCLRRRRRRRHGEKGNSPTTANAPTATRLHRAAPGCRLSGYPGEKGWANPRTLKGFRRSLPYSRTSPKGPQPYGVRSTVLPFFHCPSPPNLSPARRFCNLPGVVLVLASPKDSRRNPWVAIFVNHEYPRWP